MVTDREQEMVMRLIRTASTNRRFIKIVLVRGILVTLESPINCVGRYVWRVPAERVLIKIALKFMRAMIITFI
jgi:hypothetical protein